MHRTDMHIAIPPRPSPLSQDSTSLLSSSDQSSASTTSFVAAPGRCIHRPLDRPPTPYPGECQLCLASEHVEGKGRAEPLGALVEEEEPSGAAGTEMVVGSTGDGQVSSDSFLSRCKGDRAGCLGRGEIGTDADQEEVVRAPSSCVQLATASADHPSTASASSIVSTHATDHGQQPITETIPKRKRRPSWFKRFLSTDILAATPDPSNVPAQKAQQKVTATTSAPLRASVPESAIARNIAQPTTTQTSPVTRATAPRTRPDMRMSFAPTSLMPTLDYSYTVENSAWKAPPVVGPLVKRKHVTVG